MNRYENKPVGIVKKALVAVGLNPCVRLRGKVVDVYIRDAADLDKIPRFVGEIEVCTRVSGSSSNSRK